MDSHAIKEHLKKLKQIKKDLKKPGTPMRKRDRIPITHNNQLANVKHKVQTKDRKNKK